MPESFAVASDGTRIACQVEGAEGNDPPLVLLAGQSNNHHWWDPARDDFGRRTVTIDYRGTGSSDKPDEPYSTPGFAADVLAVLDLAGLMYTPQWRREHPGPYPVLGDATMPAYAKARHLVASNNHEAWAELPSSKAPTLILHGTDDIFSPPANAHLLANRIPNAHAELIEGARHAYFHEFQSVASPLVASFLDTL